MKKKRRGLAAVSAERRKAIARKGAKALHEQGKAHKFTSDEAKAARKKRNDRAQDQDDSNEVQGASGAVE